MWVGWVSVDLQVFQLFVGQWIVWYYVLDSFFQNVFWEMVFYDGVCGVFFDVVWVVGVLVVFFVVVFMVGQYYFVGINDDDVVIGVDVGCVGWQMFVVQMVGDVGGQMVDDYVFCVD